MGDSVRKGTRAGQKQKICTLCGHTLVKRSVEFVNLNFNQHFNSKFFPFFFNTQWLI